MNRRQAVAAIGMATPVLIGQLLDKNRIGLTTEEALGRLLPELSDRSRSVLRGALNRPRFDGTISLEDLNRLANNESKPVDWIMLKLLPLVAELAKPVVSGFRVGALSRGSSGRLYFGVNIELPGQSLSSALHAEQCAGANAYLHGEGAIEALAVTAAPCGLCRQFLWEMCFGSELRILTRGSETRLPRASLC